MTQFLAFLLIFQIGISKKEARTKIARFRASNQYRKIVEFADYILKKYPDDFEFFKYKIEALNKLGKRDTLKTLINMYLSKKRSPSVYRNLYSFLYFSVDKDFALDVLKKGRKALGSDTLFAREFYYTSLWNRDFKQALYELFNFYLQTRSITLLRQEFRRIEKFFDENTVKEVINRWLKLHPDHREVKIVLADYYMRKGRPREMLKELKESGYTRNLKEFAKYLISTGDYTHADSLLKLETLRDGAWYFLRAQVLAKLGNYRKSANLYKIAYEKFRVKDARDSLLSLLFFRLKDFNSVLRYSGPEDELRIRALLALGKDQEFLKISPAGEVQLFYRGLYFFLSENPDSAGYYWEKLARRFPASKYLYRAFFLREIQDNFGKTEVFKKFLSVENLILRWRIDSAEATLRSVQDTTGLMKFELARIQELRGDYELSVATYLGLAKERSNFLSPYAYFRAFRIASERLKNPELAGKIGKKLIEEYPRSPYAAATRSLL